MASRPSVASSTLEPGSLQGRLSDPADRRLVVDEQHGAARTPDSMREDGVGRHCAPGVSSAGNSTSKVVPTSGVL